MQEPPPQNHPLNFLIANLSASTSDPYLLQLYDRIKQYIKEKGTTLFLTEYVPLLLQHPFCNVNTYGILAVNELFKLLQYLTPQHTDIETLNLLRWTNQYTPLNMYIINTGNTDILKGVNNIDPNPIITPETCINKEVMDNNHKGVNNIDPNPTLTPEPCIIKEVIDINTNLNTTTLNIDNNNVFPTLDPCTNNSINQNEVITGILLLLQQFIPFNIKQALDLYMYICEHYNINYTSYLTRYPSLCIDTFLHRINCVLNSSPGINTLCSQSLNINTLIDKEVETYVKEYLNNTPLTTSTINNTHLSTHNTIYTLLISDLSTVKHFIIKQHLYFQNLENKSNFTISPLNNTYSNIFISSNDYKGVNDTASYPNHIYTNGCYSQVDNDFEFSNDYKGVNYNKELKNYTFMTDTYDKGYNTLNCECLNSIDSNANDSKDSNGNCTDPNPNTCINNTDPNPNTCINNTDSNPNNFTCVRQLLDKLTTYLSMFKDNTLYDIYNKYCCTNTSNKITCAKYLDRVYCNEVLKGVNNLIDTDIDTCLYVYKSIWNICINKANKGYNRVNDQGSNLEGVNDQGSNLEGVNDQGSNLEGVSNKDSNLEGFSNKDSNLEGVSNNEIGVNNSANEQHPINTTNEQHPVNPYTNPPLSINNYISHEYLEGIYNTITPSIDIPVNLLINYVKTTVTLLNAPSSSVNECIPLAGCYGYFIKHYKIKEMVMFYVCMYWMWGDKIRSVLCKWLIDVVRVIKDCENNSKSIRIDRGSNLEGDRYMECRLEGDIIGDSNLGGNKDRDNEIGVNKDSNLEGDKDRDNILEGVDDNNPIDSLIITNSSLTSIKETLGNKAKGKGLNELKIDDITVIEGEVIKGCYNSNDILGNITPFNEESYNTHVTDTNNTPLDNSSDNNTLLDNSTHNNTLLDNSTHNNTAAPDTNYPSLISELLSGLSVFECTSLSLKRIITDVSVSNDNIRKNFIGCMMEVLNYYEEEFKVIIIENMLNNSNDWRYRVMLMLKVIDHMGLKGVNLVSKLENDKVFYVRKAYEEIKRMYER